ncbi:Tectonic-1 [Holothuria leucospilota]|uniref:Tectonic-1 n=1 Tax=Holothuria leucospilota TaxID=206669 RepID=A0A9Q1CMQ9_HOLLE|nr:Tectonic-1 [Holothuria leucospilota]
MLATFNLIHGAKYFKMDSLLRDAKIGRVVLIAIFLACIPRDIFTFAQTTDVTLTGGTSEPSQSPPLSGATTNVRATSGAASSSLSPTAAQTTEATPTESTQLEFNTDLGPCICDLTANGCDVNCCCDEDCSDDDRATFSECLDQNYLVDTNVCLQSSVVFRNNSPDVVQVSDPSLFCVSRDNYVDRNYYTIPDSVQTAEEFEALSTTYASYSFEALVTTNASYEYADFYKSGDPMYTIYETLSLGVLGLPQSSISSECEDSNPAAFLFDETSSCIRTVSDLASQCGMLPSLSASTYMDGFKLVSTPKFLQENPPPEPRLVNVTTESPQSTTQSTSQVTQNSTTSNTTQEPNTSPTGGTIPDENVLYYDDPRLISMETLQPLCQILFGVEAECEFPADSVPFPTYNETEESCDNVVLKVKYSITHNATDGIMAASVQVTLGSITSSQLPLAQTFEVSFEKVDAPEDTFRRSGSPGYVIGEPLLAGTRVELEDGTKLAISLRDDRNNWLTVVKSSSDGTCLTDADSRIPVVFGMDMRTGCIVEVSFSEISDICELIQEQILTALKGPLPDDYYVAMFGDSSVEVVGDWVQVLQEEVSGTPTSSVKGTCNNMVTGVHIEVIYANVGSLQNPQPKILGVKYNYADGKILSYQCSGPFCQDTSRSFTQRFEITSSVTFIDASTQPAAVIAERPSWESKLPNDFLYPFTGTST